MNGEYEIKVSSAHIETNEDLVQDTQKKEKFSVGEKNNEWWWSIIISFLVSTHIKKYV